MIDLTNVDMEEFRDKFDQIKGIMETRTSVNNSLKEVKEELADILGINKKKVGAVIKMLFNIYEEGEPVDEELAEGVKNLYLKAKEEERED